jgi:hypothetical protein
VPQLLDVVLDSTIARCALNALLGALDARCPPASCARGARTRRLCARRRRRARLLHAIGFDAALRDACASSDRLRQKLATALQLPAAVSDVASIVDELWLRGAQSLLQSLPLATLRELALALRLATDGTRAELAKRVLVHVAELAPAPKSKKRGSAGSDSGSGKRAIQNIAVNRATSSRALRSTSCWNSGRMSAARRFARPIQSRLQRHNQTRAG